MSTRQKTFLAIAALYLLAGILFDYKLYRKNVPVPSIKYEPTIPYILGWPYYFFQSSLWKE